AISVLYSQKEELRTAACDFWCPAVRLDVKDKEQPTGVQWFPNYSDLRTALEIYGFLLDVPPQGESAIVGESHVNRKALSVRCPTFSSSSVYGFQMSCIRGKRCIFFSSEAETLLEVVVLLSLDRKLEGFLLLLHETVQSVINYFTDEEWQGACQNVARSLACRNQPRANNFRAAVSHQLLLNCFDKVNNEEGILSCLIAINMVEKECDLFKMYIYLTLTENWLLSTSVLEDKPLMCEMWGVYLRHCTFQISHGDLRPYAAKIRAKATYLLHSKTKKY
ncbi:unnamed protein product, partial [Linum tenue]